MTEILETQIVQAISKAQNETKNQILDIFFHEFICFSTSPIKVLGAFDRRIVDGVFQSKSHGIISEYRNSYVKKIQRQSKLSKPKKIINKFHRINKNKILHFDPKLINLSKNYNFLTVKHRYVIFRNKSLSICRADTAINIVEQYFKASNINISIDWKPFKNFLIENYYEPYFDGPVVTGALTSCLTRAIVNKAELLGVEHFLIVHGKMSSFAVDEPVFQYAYHRPNSHLINYGEFKSELNYGTFNAVTTFNEKEQTEAVPYDLNKCIYVPTSLSGFYTYGPYRALPDEEYLKIRSEIKKIFPGIKIKLHPKENKEFMKHHADNVKGAISQVLLQFDLFIFDYVSTAFFEVLDSEKMIVFMDYNIRKLNDEFLNDLIGVVYYVPKAKIKSFRVSELCNAEPDISMRRKFLKKYSGSHSNLMKQIREITSG